MARDVGAALLALTVAATIVWAGRQVQRLFLNLPLDVPKYLLLVAAIPMHWVVLLTPMPHKPIAIVAMLTIYHNFQYHRLVWFHNRKYARDEGCRERHGAAEFSSRRLLHYVALGVLFGVWYQVPRQYVNHTADNGAFLTQLLSGFLWATRCCTTTSTPKSGACAATPRSARRSGWSESEPTLT